ncbi:hypothetical protein ISN44_As06g038120 [Arabidopsis suecica]|uniref:DUF1985 domain-containing protein n=1 Tax=Arabidopsis suecica TaxID=45249 RepID=A0A8T2CJG7_ARASU|nr:hypothetical protein ISN44_As06g038120 [Arabidopsis suecica]
MVLFLMAPMPHASLVFFYKVVAPQNGRIFGAGGINTHKAHETIHAKWCTKLWLDSSVTSPDRANNMETGDAARDQDGAEVQLPNPNVDEEDADHDFDGEEYEGLPLGDDASQSQSRRKKRKKEDTWMKAGLSLKDILNTLSTKGNAMDPDERVRLGALILVEGILIASNPVNKIEKEHLVRASSFTEFCKYPWARIVYGSLVDCLKKITPTQLFRDQCGLPGFVFATQIWALTAVAELGQNFGSRVLEPNDNRPLISQWMTTKCPTKKDIANVTQDATSRLDTFINLIVHQSRLDTFIDLIVHQSEFLSRLQAFISLNKS